jgi:parallel beta-helix repeat protein
MLRRRVCGLAVLAGGALTFGAVPAAQAATVVCGQVITANTTVSNNLSGCTGDGLVIGANNIVLNLNGKTISGTNNNTGISFNGYNHVTVQNGRVQHFSYGLYNDGPDNTISKVTSTANSYTGIYVTGDRAKVNQSPVTNNGSYGLRSYDADNGTFSGITATGNDDYGIYLDGWSTGNTVTQSTASNNNIGIYLCGQTNATVTKSTANNNYRGIYLEYSGGSTTVSANSTTGNDYGIDVRYSNASVTVSNNRAIKNRTGFYTYDSWSGDVFSGNTAQSNTNSGFYVEYTSGTVLRNNVAGAASGLSGAGGGNGNGIYVYYTWDTLVSGNSAHGNKAGDGILVEYYNWGTDLRSNKTNRNAHDGINEQSGNASLTFNAADFNASLGIEAQPSDYDGGGNTAHGNGDPAQCTNVSC